MEDTIIANLDESIEIANVIEVRNDKHFVLGEINADSIALGKGLKFAYPQYNTTRAVIGALGNKNVLAILNGTLKRSITAKVKHSLPSKVSDEEAKRIINERLEGNPAGVIFTVADADSYEYNVKEVSTNTKFSQITKALESGAMDQSAAIMSVFKLLGVTNPLEMLAQAKAEQESA